MDLEKIIADGECVAVVRYDPATTDMHLWITSAAEAARRPEETEAGATVPILPADLELARLTGKTGQELIMAAFDTALDRRGIDRSES